jgi:LysR family hydrogen peroxide-inducible transcriptional activator
MEIHQLRYFLAIAESGSFTAAAARCRIAQPSLSQQIRRFEEQLGHRLFDRLPKGAVLTDAGRSLLPRARRILAEIDDAQASIGADLKEGRGRLVVGSIPTMAPYLLPSMLPRFVRRYPECELTLVEDLTDRLVEMLVDHSIDMAILSTPIENDAVALSVLGSERLLIAAHRDHALVARERSVSSADIDGQPAVVLDELHCLGEQLESFCATRSLNRRIVCRSTQLATILHLVGLDLGISFVPEMCARADRSSIRKYVPLVDGGPERDIAVARHSSRTPSGLASAFAALVREDLEAGRHRVLDVSVPS